MGVSRSPGTAAVRQAEPGSRSSPGHPALVLQHQPPSGSWPRALHSAPDPLVPPLYISPQDACFEAGSQL